MTDKPTVRYQPLFAHTIPAGNIRLPYIDDPRLWRALGDVATNPAQARILDPAVRDTAAIMAHIGDAVLLAMRSEAALLAMSGTLSDDEIIGYDVTVRAVRMPRQAAKQTAAENGELVKAAAK